MSVYIGLGKESTKHDEAHAQHIIKMLLDSGYIREPVEFDPDVNFLKFDEGSVEIKPAHEIDKLIK